MIVTSSKNAFISAAIIALAFVVCALILARPLDTFVNAKKSITVTGSAKKQIRSDLVVWQGSFSRQSDDLPKAYAALKQDAEKVKIYLVKKGVNQKDLVFSAVFTDTLYSSDPKTGRMTRDITGYAMRQSVEVSSKDVDRITTISREATELIDQGILFQSFPPRYFYTKLNDIKVDMLAEAAKDAAARAEKMVSATGGKIGFLRSAKMGVFQITPLNSNAVSDYGINDTSSLEKEITAVVNAEFAIQ